MSALQHLSVLALETVVESSGLDGGGRLVARISQVLGEHFGLINVNEDLLMSDIIELLPAQHETHLALSTLLKNLPEVKAA